MMIRNVSKRKTSNKVESYFVLVVTIYDNILHKISAA